MVEKMSKYNLFNKDENRTEIEKTLYLVQRYSLSHVCPKSEFKNIEDLPGNENYTPKFNYPYLDISIHYVPGFELGLEHFGIEFYFRGAMDQDLTAKLTFSNLFEYLLSTSSHGTGFINFMNQDFLLATFTE